MADVRSGAGAIGLMQLMPATAQETASKIGRPGLQSSTLLEPSNNIELGTAYLAAVLDRFRGSEVLTTAGYNAGPGRSRRWQPRARPLEADVWIDSVPFRETRKYLRGVLSYTVVYDYRLGRKPRDLLKWIGKIPTKG